MKQALSLWFVAEVDKLYHIILAVKMYVVIINKTFNALSLCRKGILHLLKVIRIYKAAIFIKPKIKVVYYFVAIRQFQFKYIVQKIGPGTGPLNTP